MMYWKDKTFLYIIHPDEKHMKKALFCTLLTLFLCLMVLPALAYCPDHPQHTADCGFDKVNEASCSHIQSLCANCQYNCMNPGHEYGDWKDNGNGTHNRQCKKCLFAESPRICSSGNCTATGNCAYCGSPNAQPHYWYRYNSDNNGTTHTRICHLDSSHTQTENCHGGNATCLKGPACVVCDQIYSPPNFNNHNYSGSYTYENNEVHRIVCLNKGCGESLRQKHSGG